MKLTHNDLVEYPGFHGTRAVAHVRVFEHPGAVPVVIIGQLDDNDGTSVTNAAEAVADAVQQRYFRDGREFVYIEFYPDGIGDTNPKRSGQYDHVEFDLVPPDERHTEHLGEAIVVGVGVVGRGEALRGGFRNPRWSHLGKERAEAMVGQELPEWPERGSYTMATATAEVGEAGDVE